MNILVTSRILHKPGAVGTRNYAAPEILSGLRNVVDILNSSLRRSKCCTGRQLLRRSLTACASTYGMVADSFSVGATIRHMVTGVPAGCDVDAFVASRNHPFSKMARSLKKRLKTSNRKRAKKYRAISDLPGDLNNLIRGLTHQDPMRRATVRSVTQHNWIKTSTMTTSLGMGQGGPLVYLDCGGHFYDNY